jgi:heme/copper-type cytochrome/quinol oxidase subunit 2
MVERLRELAGGPARVALVLVMLVGCLFLWIGVPLGWLWIGSQLEASASLGTSLMVTMVGIVFSIFVVVAMLGWVNRQHARLQIARRGDEELPPNALELIMVTSAGLAVVIFGIWFLAFAGTAPVPLNIGF